MMAPESMAIAASGVCANMRLHIAMMMANIMSLRDANGSIVTSNMAACQFVAIAREINNEEHPKNTPQGTRIAEIKKGARDTVSEIASISATTSMVVSASAFSRTGPRSAACWMEGGTAAIVKIIDCDAKTDDVSLSEALISRY